MEVPLSINRGHFSRVVSLVSTVKVITWLGVVCCALTALKNKRHLTDM